MGNLEQRPKVRFSYVAWRINIDLVEQSKRRKVKSFLVYFRGRGQKRRTVSVNFYLSSYIGDKLSENVG